MENNGEDKKYPEGHFIGMWLGIGISIFTGVGIPLSFALNNPGLIGIGPAIGVVIGVAIGTSIENKHKKEGLIRPRTKKERSNRNILLISLIALGIIGLAILLTRIF